MGKGSNPRSLENLQPWQPGNPGGPGRPKGSRSRLQEKVLAALAADFEIHGPDVIAKVRQRKPEVYLTAMVSLLPKQAQKVESPFADISDAELEALEQHLAVVRAKLVKDIEHEPQNTDPSRGRVANTATDTPGQSIQNADAVIVEGQANALDAERLDSPDALDMDRNHRTVDGVDDAA